MVQSRGKVYEEDHMQRSPDVVVIGGGIVGSAAAYQLAKEGLRVTLLEAESIGSGCTFHGTGLLAPYRELNLLNVDADRAISAASFKATMQLLPELSKETGIGNLMQVKEGLRVATTDE